MGLEIRTNLLTYKDIYCRVFRDSAALRCMYSAIGSLLDARLYPETLYVVWCLKKRAWRNGKFMPRLAHELLPSDGRLAAIKFRSGTLQQLTAKKMC